MKLQVFVYGTLKSGYGNHILCQGAEQIIPSTVVGRIYNYSGHGGFPMTMTPPAHTIMPASPDRAADIEHSSVLQGTKEAKIEKYPFDIPPAEDHTKKPWVDVQGELIIFSGDTSTLVRRLTSLDSLEGFNPHNSRNTFYERVYTLCKTADGYRYCWIYISPEQQEPQGMHLEAGVWPYERVRV